MAMADYNAVADVGKVLIKLILENIADDDPVKPLIGSSDKISQSSPEELSDGQSLSVFLYQITEDTYQKNGDMQISGPDKLQSPPFYLNLFYLITANTKSGENDNIAIGKIIQIFNDNPVIKGPVLEGTTLEGESLNLIFNPLSLEEINKIWNVLSKSKPYKLSAYYEVTPVRIDSTGERTISRISES